MVAANHWLPPGSQPRSTENINKKHLRAVMPERNPRYRNNGINLIRLQRKAKATAAIIPRRDTARFIAQTAYLLARIATVGRSAGNSFQKSTDATLHR